MEVLILFVFGLIVGSFLNVCIYRIPRQISIIKPFSFCPSCKNKIKPYHNIPIFSYLFLRGKCAYCGDSISLRYPLVEFLNGVLYVLAFLNFGLTLILPFVLIFISALLVISFIDIDFQIIPDTISIPLIAIGLIVSLIPHGFSNLSEGLIESIIGILVGGGSLLLISIISRGGMGGGDIKLNAAVGSFMGWKSAVLTIFIGSLLGSIIGIIILKKTGNRKIPFGPYLAIGALVSLFMADKILDWYLR
ncbi:prepilin peptidase [Thermodesulfovibrio sp.]|uniref:prepilin peptidase n=1 Tax=Thermodesulfovibrio sp. TaxID=2067987 RepID=UPI0030B67C80